MVCYELGEFGHGLIFMYEISPILFIIGVFLLSLGSFMIGVKYGLYFIEIALGLIRSNKRRR